MLPDLTLFLDVQRCSQVILNWLSYCMHVILDLSSSCIPGNYHKSGLCKTRTIFPYSVITMCRLEEMHSCVSVPLTEISDHYIDYNSLKIMLYNSLK
jgi:hypothetical protein